MFFFFWTIIQKVDVLVDISKNRSWTSCPVLEPPILCHSPTLCIEYRSGSWKKPGSFELSPTKHGDARAYTQCSNLLPLPCFGSSKDIILWELCQQKNAERTIFFHFLGHVAKKWRKTKFDTMWPTFWDWHLIVFAGVFEGFWRRLKVFAGTTFRIKRAHHRSKIDML